ncbi:MAG: hypothetical protein M3N19_11645 [Candidatus Eremiobacteraeota bacterium]|nr:hypothetical protein [Candidatus Eremiobacteraeota bacterium]
MLSLATFAFVAALSQMGEQTVHVKAYGCNFNGSEAVSVLAQNDRLLHERRRMRVPATVETDHSLQFTLRLPPGSFDIKFESQGEHKCESGGEGLTILPGHDRHIVTSLRQLSEHPKELAWVRDWHEGKFFAGTLLGPGLSVSIVAIDRAGCPNSTDPEHAATIDGDAYYAGYISGKHTFLKLRSSGFDVLYIALTDASNMNSYHQYLVRDVTLDDIRTLTTHETSDNQCIATPTGASSDFAS